MEIKEVQLTDEVVRELIAMSEDWEAENSCHGYRKNTYADLEGNRVFFAEENGVAVGYPFGKKEQAKEDTPMEIHSARTCRNQRPTGAGKATPPTCSTGRENGQSGVWGGPNKRVRISKRISSLIACPFHAV